MNELLKRHSLKITSNHGGTPGISLIENTQVNLGRGDSLSALILDPIRVHRKNDYQELKKRDKNESCYFFLPQLICLGNSSKHNKTGHTPHFDISFLKVNFTSV